MSQPNQAVADYLQKVEQPWQAEICQRLDQVVRQVLPDVEARLQYSKPHYLKNGKYACVYGTARGWVSFTIFNAAGLEAPAGFFEPSDAVDRKTIKIKPGQTVDYDLLGRLIQQAASTL